jgi:menaquinone-dependent protoporphyrinogen oxidase
MLAATVPKKRAIAEGGGAGMARILILYGTTEGQTATISEYIAEVVRDHGDEAETLDIKRLSSGFALDAYEAVIVGASIHMGAHEEYVRAFVKRNREALERMPSAFFSVSLTAQEHTDEARAKTKAYVEKFVDETGWHPDMVGIFGGALRYTQYGFVKRHLMKKIAKDKGSADTSRDYAYTDWNDVRHFAEEFLQQGLPAGR